MTTITRFHDLCIDVVIEILSYFNVHEIFYSFCLLIPCLPTLLANGHVRLHVRSNNSYFIRWILPHIKLTQVISLNVPTRPYNPSIFQFTALRSLVLRDVDNPLLLFEKNNNWPPYYLEHLSLHIRNQDIPNISSNIGIRVLECAFQLQKLKHFELHESKSSLKMVELYEQLNFPSTFQSTNIKYLILTVYCNWKTLQSILYYSPNLYYFQFRSSFNSSEIRFPQLYFTSIRKLNLRLDGLKTDIFLSIFRNSPFLRQCKLQCSFFPSKQYRIDLLRSDTWIQLFDTYTPQLKTLNVDMTFPLDNLDEETIETINEDFKILNFKLNFHSDNVKPCWKITGTFNRI
ncbi:unnamed protein product [Rotaria sp. Silwood1]|nr:unnamed protein product [Rotaria sp. Silwood1]CAF0941416.1 unnamed protein product [Rotaria sp. Silwood1]CAF3398098.1 unnamed protein product [Rotaria sp. Silwood1]CAF4905894.1 unnamed protein product [Rotaria sp. Silwood1]